MNSDSESLNCDSVAGQTLALALDIGTSSVRAALYDERGREVRGTQARVRRSLRTSFDGGAELDADEGVAEVARAIDGVLARSENLASSPIETVAVSCFWHSLVGVNFEGRPVTPVFGWADTRAARFIEELRRRFDEAEVHARVGCRFHPSYWPAKLLWLRAERPDTYGAARFWLSFAELLSNAFFKRMSTSVSMASGTGLLNLRSIEWDEELLGHLQIETSELPLIEKRHAPLGELSEKYARRWPRLSGARWFPAIADGAANNIGAGCVGRASAALMIGTSGAMRVLWEGEPPEQLPKSLWCYRADGRRVLVGGALSDGGGLFDWMTNALRVGEEAEEIERALAAMEPDAHGLTLLPFWAGERSTNWRADARGAILGLMMHTRPVEILRAAMEAIAYRFALTERELAAFAPAAKIVATGGALAASSVWSQMLADVLGRTLYLSAVNEASSRGAVLLALEATGKLKSITEAPAPFVRAFEPDATRHALYQTGLERQQEIYARLLT